MKAKSVGIEALVVAAHAAGYAMAPAEDVEADFDASPALSEAEPAAPEQSRALTVITPQLEAAQSLAQTVTTWVRGHLPAIGWRAPA